jgi:arsenate reductase
MKKAFAWLDARKIAYEFHDYKKDGVPPGKLKAWAAKVGWEKLANTRGPTWRKIPDAEKRNPSASAVIKLLEANSSAIKRPVIEADGELLVGFDPDEYAKAF